MRYEVVHTLRYEYSAPVSLGPHVVRLVPRSGADQRLTEVGWEVLPAPARSSRVLDAGGNDALALWFDGPTRELSLRFVSRVETLRANPFDYVPAGGFPAGETAADLGPYRAAPGPDDALDALCLGARREARDPVDFLVRLCRRIHQDVAKEVREEGPARAPAATWALRRGACRDAAVLFIDGCRRQGFAARFVSGYFEDDPRRLERDLHAWAEVYVEGGGWRGFDPSAGLAAADRHVALASAAEPSGAAPLEGRFAGEGASSRLRYAVSMTRRDATG